MANVNLINSVAKAYRSMNASLVTQAGATSLVSGISTAGKFILEGFREVKEASRKSAQALQKKLDYTPENFEDLDLTEEQINVIDDIYNEYNEGIKLATNPNKRQRDEESGKNMMNNAKKRLDDLYDSLTSFGTLLNSVKKNANENIRSDYNDPMQVVLYDYMVNNYQDFMKNNVKIEESTSRAFIELPEAEGKYYLDELEELTNFDKKAVNNIDIDLRSDVDKIATKNLSAEVRNRKITELINGKFNLITDNNQRGSLIFDSIHKDAFLDFLVTDESFSKAYPGLAEQIPKIKTPEDAEDVATAIEVALIQAMKFGEYDLFNDYREFTIQSLANVVEDVDDDDDDNDDDETNTVAVQLQNKGLQYFPKSRIEENKKAVAAGSPVLGLDGKRYLPEKDRTGKIIGYTNNTEGVRNFLPIDTFKYNNILFGQSASKLP
tara:strand:- start:1079 stop:2389 length:1311 start_codon:yes stop_codon:yes gene_type:complete